MTDAVATALIVEDEPLLRKELRERLATHWPDLDVVAEAEDGIAAAKALATARFDVVFLDIRLPGLDGLEIARLASGRAHVVFVTAHQEYAVAAFETEAVDYLVKPLDDARMAAMVQRVKRHIDTRPRDLGGMLDRIQGGASRQPLRWIQGSVGNRIRIVPIEDVSWFESDAKYTRVVCGEGDLHIRRAIKDLVGDLDPAGFWQINRSTIINVARIQDVKVDPERMEVRMRGHTELLAVSRPYHNRFKRM